MFARECFGKRFEMTDLETAKVIYTRALAAQRKGNFGLAERLLRQTLTGMPGDLAVMRHLAEVQVAQGAYEKCLRLCRSVLSAQPAQVWAWLAGARCELELGEPAQALQSVEQARRLAPGESAVFSVRAQILYRLGRFDEALSDYDEAVRREPMVAEWHTARGVVLRAMGRLEESVQAHERALRIAPEHPAANWNAAIADLTQGNFASGWRRFEWRWHTEHERTSQRYQGKARRWHGEPVAGLRILLWAERSLGEVLQFARFATTLREIGAIVILQVPPELVDILRTMEAAFIVVAEGDPLPPHDFHAPLLSVPYHLKMDDVPVQDAYLAVPQREGRSWQTVPRRGAARMRVGLMWEGRRVGGQVQGRSMSVSDLAPLLLLPCDFVALAKEIPENDRRILRQFVNFTEYTAEITDFGDTANLIESLDLVITVDTSVAHLSAAMGRQTWVLLPLNANWCWGSGESFSPWYPRCTRLFRQSGLSGWDRVVGDVILCLGEELVRHDILPV